MAQQPYDGFKVAPDVFPEIHDQRAPCVLVMDVSGSMGGEPIRELNEGLVQYRDEVLGDSLAARRVDIALVTFGEKVELALTFTDAYGFAPKPLAAGGPTPMAAAIVLAAKILEDRKADYRQIGVPYYRPWVFLFTDGAPTDLPHEWQLACETVRQGEAQGKFTFYAVGVESADVAKLKEISPARSPLKLRGLAFREFFKWLSNSQGRVAHSRPGENIALPPATGDAGWGSVVL
jgi:uncharacterized protein YegL